MGTEQTSTPARMAVGQAAAYTGISASTLNKLRMGSDGPTYLKLGRRVTYDVRDLDTWLASKRRQSTSEVSAEAA